MNVTIINIKIIGRKLASKSKHQKLKQKQSKLINLGPTLRNSLRIYIQPES